MSDPSLAVQGAIVARLKALGTEAGSKVYDRVSLLNPKPYISIGTGQTVPIDETCWDGSEVSLQLDVWSDEPGYPQVKRIAGAIRVGLHDQDLAIPGHVCDRVEVRGIDYSREANGLTSRARIDLLITTQPA